MNKSQVKRLSTSVEEEVITEMAEGRGQGMSRPWTPTGRTAPARVVGTPGSPEEVIERIMGQPGEALYDATIQKLDEVNNSEGPQRRAAQP